MSTVRAKLTLVFALSILAAFSSAVYAAEVAPALQKGSQALQFAIGYDFKLSPFQGATISCERFLRDRLALRLGGQISTDYSDGPLVDRYQDGITGSSQVDIARWRHEYSVSCHLVSYRDGRVGLFYGGGPKVTYSNYLYEDFYVNVYDGHVASNRWRTWEYSWGVGLEGVVGVQWVLNDRFRLQAQYATAAMYGRRFSEDLRLRTEGTVNSDRSTYDSHFVQITPEGVQAGLAVTF